MNDMQEGAGAPQARKSADSFFAVRRGRIEMYGRGVDLPAQRRTVNTGQISIMDHERRWQFEMSTHHQARSSRLKVSGQGYPSPPSE